ncbi:MAG: hypothetical protein R3A52_10045 [Polyangiales bacterium]
MSTTSIAETAGTARQRLAASLQALQSDPNVPPAVMDIVASLARAMGPLYQVEQGQAPPTALYTARAVLQEALAKMQAVDQSYPGVSDATAAIAQSLGLLFATIKEHNIADPTPAPQAPAPTAAPVPLVQPAVQPVPLVQPVAQPVPLVQPAQTSSPPQPAPVMQQPPAPVFTETAGPPPSRAPSVPAARGSMPSGPLSVFPETAAKVPVGPNGVPRLEAEVSVHSDTNFYTNFLGDIRDHGGIFVATYATLAIHQPCEVVILFPGELQGEVKGSVKWRREPSATDASAVPGLGVEIKHASAETWSLIERYIRKREPIMHEV